MEVRDNLLPSKRQYVGRIDTVEAVKQSAMASLFQGHFTNGFCKMWVKDRALARGVSVRYWVQSP
jgi:hypothetical protein